MTPPGSATGERQRALLISRDVLGSKMAGPGIRYYHLGRILSRHTTLTLAIRPQDDQALAAIQDKLPNVTLIAYETGQWGSIQRAAEQADTIIASPYTIPDFPQLTALPSALVIDGYDPLLIEWLATLPPDNPAQQWTHWQLRMADLFLQYLSGDFFICASERQRQWWLGQLEAAGRVNPRTYQADPSLRSLVDVVAYGLPEEPIAHSKQVVKGVWPGITLDDIVLLWGGGLWSWLDPVTAVRALARLHADHPRLKLIFPGTIHPNPEMAAMPVRNTEVYSLAEETGLLNKAIFFGEWVPYDDWPNVLLESDIALSLHHDTVETQLAFRSRVLEYIWAGVPIIATRGDTTSQLIARYQVGQVVDYESVDDVVQAIRRLIKAGPGRYQQGAHTAREELTWERTAEPLIRFCQNPRRAADRRQAEASGVPYYELRLQQHELRLQQMAQQQQQLEALVQGYEQGKMMRLLRRLNKLRNQLLPTNRS